MATTRISDAVVPGIFTQYVINRTMAKSALFRSGIVVPDPQIDALAKGANKVYDMPYWSDLSGSGRSNAGSDDESVKAVAAKIGSGKDKARKHFRNKSWSTMDLTSILAGSDPANAIVEQVSDYWAADTQTTLIVTLNGVIASNVANNGGDMVVDISLPGAGTPGAGNKIGPNVVLAAKQTMGDAADALTAVVMHSVIHTELQRQNLIASVPNSAQDIGFGVYLGRYTVIVDDGVPVVMNGSNPVYTTYLFGRGAIGYGEGSPSEPTYVTRDEAAGNGEGMEVVGNRKHYILHPRGIRWTEAADTAVSPSDAELANATNWQRVYDRKKVRFVAIKTNG